MNDSAAVGESGMTEQGAEAPNAMKTLFSVILCTHNPRQEYLRRTLDALRRQTLRYDAWEFLLVDNASTQLLADVWDLSWHPRARHIREDELGMTPALLRGFDEASGELFVIVADDNVLAADYLEQVAAIHASHPHLAVFGSGRLEPEFEIEPPAELARLLSMLALRTVKTSLWSNNPTDFRCMPWGAGMCVTRAVTSVFRELLVRLDIRGIVGRRGQRLSCGDDDLFSWAAAASGRGFGIFPQLQLTHLIAARRLNRAYFLRLIHDHAYSNGILNYLLAGTKQKPLDTFRVGRTILHGVRNGYFSTRCEWAAARGEAAALRYIRENNLRPIALHEGLGRSSPLVSWAGVESRPA